MPRPLHQSAQAVQADPGKQPHWGLWFDKFCNTWRVNGADWSMAAPQGQTNPREEWLKTLSGRSLGEPAALTEHAQRQHTLATSLGGRSWVVQTTSPFLTGAGRPHPIENGLAFHPTLGAPFMPGSGVKGMLRAAARELGLADDAIAQLFGNRTGDDAQVGALVCLDLVPIETTTMIADILTPHYGDWVQGRNLNAPGDWSSPIPVPFLAVNSGAKFLLTLFPNPNGALAVGLHNASAADRDAWWADWEQLVTDALGLFGAGAKTMAGYGRFKLLPNDGFLHKAQERALRLRRQSLPPHLRVAEECHALTAQGRLDKVDALRRNEIDGEEATLWRSALRKHPDFDLWRRGEKPDPALNLSADKLKERADLLLTDEERAQANTASPEQEMNDLLLKLQKKEIEPIPAMQDALQPGRWPQRQLQTLHKWLKKDLGKKVRGQKEQLLGELEKLSKKPD